MIKQGIIDYCLHTPENTNPALLKQMLNKYTDYNSDWLIYNFENVISVDDDRFTTIYINNWDEKDAQYYAAKFDPRKYGCSVVRTNNTFHRNFDWYYDDAVTIQLLMGDNYGKRHRSINTVGACGLMKEKFDNWTNADNVEFSYDDFAHIPFMTVDGVNEKKVYCNSNVVPKDYGITTGTNPGAPSLNMLGVCRYVLDYADSADDAIAKLSKMDVYAPANFEYELHYMIADEENTYVVEFINNKMVVIDEFVDNKPIMTNFFLYGFDGTKATLTPYGSGYERYLILKDNYEDIAAGDETSLVAAYTIGYDNTLENKWYSDYVGDWSAAGFGIITNASPEEEIDPLINHMHEIFTNRVRGDKKTWQTVHAVKYEYTDEGCLNSYFTQEDAENVIDGQGIEWDL